MHLLSTLLLGISTNLDNLLIGVSFGFLKKRIAMKANLVIGLFSAAATCFFCYFSSMFSRFGRIPNIIGGIIIILIGAFSLILSKEYDGIMERHHGLGQRSCHKLHSCGNRRGAYRVIAVKRFTGSRSA